MAWQGPKSASQTTTTESTTTAEAVQVQVQVGGVALSLRSSKDPSLVHDIAAYVNEKVDTVKAAAPSVRIDKALMLASLNVAEELFEARARVLELETALQTHVDACLAVITEMERDAH